MTIRFLRINWNKHKMHPGPPVHAFKQSSQCPGQISFWTLLCTTKLVVTSKLHSGPEYEVGDIVFVLLLLLLFSLSVMSDSSVTPWTVACQAPLSMGFSRQEYWSGFSRGSSRSRGQTCVSCIGRQIPYL